MREFWKKHRKIAILGIILPVVWLLTVGPWPVPEVFGPSLAGREYRQATLARLDAAPVAAGRGELLAGTARAEITAVSGQPLMGFTNRSPLACAGVHSPCYATALTLSCGGARATFVSFDIFILFPDLTAEIVRRSGIPAAELYFTASHTHSGPGGWVSGLLMQALYGRSKAEYREKIVSAAASAINRSRENLRPGAAFYRRAPTPGMLENRIYKGVRPARETADALLIRGADGKLLAAFMAYSAHATLVRPKEHRCSADYPGFWRDAWEQSQGGLAMFAAGGVGDARAASGSRAESFGAGLARCLERAAEVPLDVDTLAVLRLPVDAPQTRLPCGKKWRWLPWIAPRLLGGRTHLSGVRLGKMVWVGWPGDVAGELVSRLDAYAASRGARAAVTSFNGDWRGYFTSAETWDARDAYETRMGFLGRDGGEYFLELGQRLVDRLLTVR